MSVEYKDIAMDINDALRTDPEGYPSFYAEASEAKKDAIKLVARNIADTFEDADPDFDRAQFLNICYGVTNI